MNLLVTMKSCQVKIVNNGGVYHYSHLHTPLKGGPSDLGTKIFTNIQKDHPYTPKAFEFSFIKTQLSKAIRQQEKIESY